jgi:hypothetical protein
LDKEREGIISTAKNAIVETAKAGLDVAVSGIEVTKDAAISGGTAVGDAVSALATKTRKAIRKRRSPKRGTASARTRKKSSSKTGSARSKTAAARWHHLEEQTCRSEQFS